MGAAEGYSSVFGSPHRRGVIPWTVFLASCSERELYLGHGSGWVHREQPSAFRRDVMSFSRQRAASVDGGAPESQTLVLSYDAYPLHVQLPSLTFRAERTQAGIILLPSVLCMISPQCLIQKSLSSSKGSKSRCQLIYHLDYRVKSNLGLTGYLVYNLSIYPVRSAHECPAQDALMWASSTESMVGKVRVGCTSELVRFLSLKDVTLDTSVCARVPLASKGDRAWHFQESCLVLDESMRMKPRPRVIG